MKYIKPLDSLRAIAVLLVIAWHWIPGDIMRPYQTGPAGVVIFFVLSGFLITRILLEGRNETERTDGSKKTFFKNFFFRRALRIFPIYYILIIPFFLYAVFTHQDVYRYFYFLTYTSNFYFFNTQSWDHNFSHIWTLAVEEQFYLVWPFIILFIRKELLLACILIFISTGIISQCIAGENGFGMYLTFTCFDSLGMGALLAWVTVYKPQFLKSLCKITGVISAAMMILICFEIFKLHFMVFPFRIQVSVIALFIISYIVYTSYYHVKLPSMLNFILNNNALASLGKISYGVYLYHIQIPRLTGTIIYGTIYHHLPPIIFNNFKLLFGILNLVVLIIVSSWSWKLIEKPILNLKKYFGGKEENRPAQPSRIIAAASKEV